MDIKKYNLPLTCITVIGSKARMTPGLVALFASELAKQRINIHAISSGEYALSFYIDGERGAEAVKALQPGVLKKSAFQGISLRKDIGMISLTGDEFVNTPGMFARALFPLGEKGINILSVSTGFDSVLVFLDMQDVNHAFKILGGSFADERPQAAPFTLEQLEEEAAEKKAEEEQASLPFANVKTIQKKEKPEAKTKKPAKKAAKKPAPKKIAVKKSAKNVFKLIERKAVAKAKKRKTPQPKKAKPRKRK